jgi:hypothetical protein
MAGVPDQRAFQRGQDVSPHKRWIASMSSALRTVQLAVQQFGHLADGG